MSNKSSEECSEVASHVAHTQFEMQNETTTNATTNLNTDSIPTPDASPERKSQVSHHQEEQRPLPPTSQPGSSSSHGQAPKSKLQFADLSEELKSLIIGWVLRPSDLKHVCLVNKQLHEIAVRYLYRHVALDLGSPNDTRLSSFLNPRNIGLKHVKQLRLYLHVNPPDRCLNQEQQAHFATRMLLEFLPEDILEEFSWCPWRPFSLANLLLLYKRQRKMRWLEVMDLDRNALSELKKDGRLQSSVFTNVRKLALYPENHETLDLSGFYVEKSADMIEELIVHCNFHSLDPREPAVIDSRELNDSATAPGLLTSRIFRCKMPFDKATPFRNLSSLRLHRVSLRHCADTWCKLVDFNQLQFLRLYHCSGSDTLLGNLCKSSHLPKQLKVLEVQHRDNDENELLMALDGFLCIVSGIRDLVVDLEHVKSMPGAAGIVRHGKTLEILNVHCAQENNVVTSISASDYDKDEHFWEVDDFDKICEACTRLDQLSCAWPPTSLIRSPSDEWRAYENASNRLKNLITLHITTWPTNKPSTQLLPRAVYETLLQALAQRAFELAYGSHVSQTSIASSSASTSDVEEIHPPSTSEESGPSPLSTRASRLRLIAFGTSDKIYERENSKNQIIYLRSTYYDAENRPRVYAAPLGWTLRQFVEPRSEILDFVLHRSDSHDRPPCREPVPGRETVGGWGDDDDVIEV